MAVEAQGGDLLRVVALLGAGVVAVPLFRRLGLGSVLGYLAGGLVIGPFGLGLFSDPEAILHIAEIGVVMFLFIIGLEMQPGRLWNLRRQIFGLGVMQVSLCGALLTAVGIGILGLPPPTAFVAALGLTLSSTAMVMQLLDERGESATPPGQKVVSILLLEDLAIVPLLALVAFLAPAGDADAGASRWGGVLIGLGAVAGLVVAGRWLLSPMFRVLAAARAREVMTAAALLVVLGSALLMQWGGLSMAMGAFLAGVLLSESSFRHQLEADIEPFRGILLGLFFLGVGMSLDLGVFARHWPLLLGGVLAFKLLKGAAVYVVARLTRAQHRDAMHRALTMSQGGEFAFVLFAAAAAAGLFNVELHALLTAIVILSMALTPLGMLALRWLAPEPDDSPSMDGVDVANDLHGDVLIVGFGRFGQVASQSLLARGIDVTIIDIDTERIRNAARFGFKVYFGDGTRLDVLHACGADRASAVAVCVNDQAAASQISQLVRHSFPQAKVLVRAFDRQHALTLIQAGVDFQIRETLGSAMTLGEATLKAVGVPAAEAAEIVDDVRRRDAERLTLEVAGGIGAGRDLLHGNAPVPAPLTTPRRSAKALNDAAAQATGDATS
ncbi:monovalent cation:proton antiporter-2 (CPA2) family protein [Flagellatimonas centrodinii]|uniref:monovalent cation:proton antiporter-2 (CPA2) family protein n=1 Tax=Flagellatimonas centrodinii TaxID=2806210 RepID=UPI001FF764F8|nr:monovalent cation:proton antiporter-2 (CPA2) family protein [Flagellatimonas centrodinii]ULQ46071.1 monovalent cation:proton antiporter-2 (CPA2) family protein [Flagellatimonas centrodinii]